MPTIKTASWFQPLPPGHVKIGISRSVPRNERPGYRRLRALEPGPWFNSVAPDEYLRRCNRIPRYRTERQIVVERSAR